MRRLRYWIFLLVIFTCLHPRLSWSEPDQSADIVIQSIAEADELQEQFQFQASLMHLDEVLQRFPASPRLHKKRGDVLMILGRNHEALASYRKALTLAPDWIDGHWALWAVLTRLSLDLDLALDSLFHIADLDSHNPLAQIHVARNLREQGQFEKSVVYFRRAVEIEPTHPAYRLFLARALYDVLSKEEAKAEVQWVLSHTAQGSPEWIAAQNLSQIMGGASTDKGIRSEFFEHTKEPYGKEGKDYKSWALTREKAWQLMGVGEYTKAESMLRAVLTLDPEDDQTRYNLGLTLFKLEKYEEAIASLQTSFQKSMQPFFYPDALFHIGQAFAKLEKWENAIDYYQQIFALQELKEQDYYAMNFPDLHRVEAALKEARSHVTNIPQSQMIGETAPSPHRPAPSIKEERLLTRSSHASSQGLLKKEIPLRVLPLSVDVVRGWFRHLTTAKSAIQDEGQAGLHEFIPLDPGDTFSPGQSRIYLVFSLTTPPADVQPITSQWVGETVEGLAPNTVVGTDSVLVNLSDNSGYFFLEQPEGGWPVGTYRIDLFVGEEISPYAYVADVRFRIQPGHTSIQ